jgi:hypothetical protein
MANNKTMRALSRHTKALGILGALIIFITFVAREGFREGAKDQSDKLSTAESVFLIRGGAVLAPFSIDTFDHAIQRKEAQLATNVSGETTSSETSILEEAVDLIRAEISMIDSGLDNCRRFQRKIEDVSPGITANLTNADVALKAMHEQEGRISAVVAVYSVEHKRNVTEDFRHQIIELGAQSSSVAKSLIETQNNLLMEAQEREHRLDSLLTGFTIASFVLYFVGWALAFVGKLGREEIIDED